MPTDKPSFMSSIVSALVAIAIFIAGYLLNQYGEVRERKRTIQNIKSVVFKEMAHNYKNLNLIVPKEHEYSLGMIEIPVEVAESLSFEIYEKYLDRLAELKSDEVDKIFDAYIQLQGFRDSAKEFTAMPTTASKAERTAREGVLLRNMGVAYEHLESALRVFEGGESFVKGETANRGKEYYRIFNAATKAIQELKKSYTPASSDH